MRNEQRQDRFSHEFSRIDTKEPSSLPFFVNIRVHSWPRKDCQVPGSIRSAFMKCFSFVLGLFFILAAPAAAADDPVQKALKAIEKHRYEEAGRDLRQALKSMPAAKQPQAQLALGMAYLRNAELHRSLYVASVAVNADYLKRLAGDRGAGRSRAGDLYLGVVTLESGKADAAAQAFEKFLAGGPVDERSAALARVGLGTARWMSGDKAKAQEQWDAVKGDGEVKSELAEALSRAGLKDKDPAALCGEAVTASRKGGKGLPQAVIKNCLGVYVRTG